MTKGIRVYFQATNMATARESHRICKWQWVVSEHLSKESTVACLTNEMDKPTFDLSQAHSSISGPWQWLSDAGLRVTWSRSVKIGVMG